MNVVFFDGYCNLCNGFIDFLVARDHGRSLKYASLQGQTAKQQLPAHLHNDVTTMAFSQNGTLHTESSAALRAIAQLGGIYKIAKILLVIPSFIRNLVYRAIAKNRYSLFGKRDTCRLPTPEERTLFLD